MAALVALPAFKAWITKAMAKNTLKKTTAVMTEMEITATWHPAPAPPAITAQSPRARIEAISLPLRRVTPVTRHQTGIQRQAPGRVLVVTPMWRLVPVPPAIARTQAILLPRHRVILATRRQLGSRRQALVVTPTLRLALAAPATTAQSPRARTEAIFPPQHRATPATQHQLGNRQD